MFSIRNSLYGPFSSSRNKGGAPQNLISCRLAGWDRDGQFRVQVLQEAPAGPGPEDGGGRSGDSDTSSSDSRSENRSREALASSREVSPGGRLSLPSA